MSDATKSWETIAGCKINVLRGGRGAPLLFLHGARGAGVWLPFFKALSEHYEVIVPEHPGFGRSDTPEWLDNVGDLANFYLEFIAEARLAGASIWSATSLGGWIAADLAVRNNDPLRTLTLVAAGRHPRAGRAEGRSLSVDARAGRAQSVLRSDARRSHARSRRPTRRSASAR